MQAKQKMECQIPNAASSLGFHPKPCIPEAVLGKDPWSNAAKVREKELE
jgi:hypothetical protein